MFEVRKADARSSKPAYHVLLKYLSTFEGCEENELNEALPYAVEATVLAIKLEAVLRFDDLLELSAVKLMQNHENHSKLFELLTLFAGEKLASFDSFNEKYPDYLESLGLLKEDCLKKIRLLSLATLASEHSELTYDQVAKALNISLDEVESWVIFAVSAKLIEAKLDQMNQTVFVHHYSQRVFTDKQWKHLQTTLYTWKSNVQELLSILEKSGGVANFVP